MITGIISGSTAPRSARAELDECRPSLRHARRAEEIAVDHQPDADHQTRRGTAQEQPTDRSIADRAINDCHDRWRHHRRDGRAGGDQRRRKGRRITLVAHRRHEHGADSDRVGGGGARDAAEDHARHRHDMRQPAAQMADHRLGQRDQPRGDARRRHQLADQQEERDRQQRQFVDAVEKLPHQRADRELREQRRDDHHGGDQRECHRQPGIAQKQEQSAHHHDGGFVAAHCAGCRSTASRIGSAASRPGWRIRRVGEAVHQAVDQLLHRKQRDQCAGRRDRRVQHGDRRERRHQVAAEAVQDN